MDSSLNHTAVIGLGWGDEGKGKVVDLLGPDFDIVVRFNGGANAGHTIRVGERTYKLHLLPAGVLHEHQRAVIGPGVVVDPATLLQELDGLAAGGMGPSGRLVISDRAHVVMPWHKIEDRLSEAASDSTRIGTTIRGIGPCYADKVRRHSAIRVGDLRDSVFLRDRLPTMATVRRDVLTRLFGPGADFHVEQIVSDLRAQAERIGPMIGDTSRLLEHAIRSRKRLLFEGANGALLDIDHGTYPFVTSSTTTAAGIPSGAGVPPGTVTRVIGVCKAYSTRVGEGPFVSELRDSTGEWIRERGREFGTTTGRPRRCGWFDAVATRSSVWMSGVTEVALMHLDTLSGAESIGVCVGYDLDGSRLERIPADTALLQRVTPAIEFHPGWTEPLSDARRFDDLPPAARRYVHRLSELIGAPIQTISIGPERTQTIRMDS